MEFLTAILAAVPWDLVGTALASAVAARYPVVGRLLDWLLRRSLPGPVAPPEPVPLPPEPTSRPVLDAVRRLFDRVIQGRASEAEVAAAQAIYDATPDLPPEHFG